MGYLGNTPGESFISFAKQVFTIVNSQTAYTLNFAVVDENELRLVINNVVQEPGSGKAYTASGTTLTLSAALTNGTDEMYCVFLGKARETVTVPTITKDKLNLISTSSSAGLEVKGDGTTDGTLQLNCSQNSHGIKLASPPHSAGQSYTLTFPQSISADTFLKTDGSGNLSFASAGGANTPAFSVYLSGNLSLSNETYTKLTFDTEEYDSGSVFASNKFTPGVVGKYVFNAGASIDSDQSSNLDQSKLALYKNGSAIRIVEPDLRGNPGRRNNPVFSHFINVTSTSDYFEIFVYHSAAISTSGVFVQGGSSYTYFNGYKIIE